MAFNYKQFSESIKLKRNLLGISQYDFSIKIDIDYSTYCSIETCNKKPNFRTAIKIANALKSTINELENTTNTLSDTDNVKSNLNHCILRKLYLINDKTLLIGLHEVLMLIKTQEDKIE